MMINLFHIGHPVSKIKHKKEILVWYINEKYVFQMCFSTSTNITSGCVKILYYMYL